MPDVFGLGAIFLLFMGFALLVIAWKTIKIVPQSSVLLIERLGRFHRVAASGLNIIVPFFESPRAVYWTNARPGMTSIDLREQFIDLPPQSVISRDNVMMGVDSVEHGSYAGPESYPLFKKNGSYLVPTLLIAQRVYEVAKAHPEQLPPSSAAKARAVRWRLAKASARLARVTMPITLLRRTTGSCLTRCVSIRCTT